MRANPDHAPAPAAGDDYQALFLAHLPFIHRSLGALCRRYHMSPDDADEFTSWATCRLIERDYAVLRKFRGESALRTYLVAVIARLRREYFVLQRGRWRPSAAARRAGHDAVLLEALVHRDGYGRDAAIQALRTSGATRRSAAELVAVLASLPRRTAWRRRVDADDLARDLGDRCDAATADSLVREAEAAAARHDAAAALEDALESLPVTDRAIVRMHYWENMTVASIARALDERQPPLYRRLERTLARLRAACEARGLTAADVGAALADAVE